MMNTRSTQTRIRAAAVAALLAALLTACGKPAPQDDSSTVPPPAPASEATSPLPSGLPPPEESPAAPAQPAPEAPPPTGPSPAPKPTAANEPALNAMQLARPSAKLSVPVDLRYSFDAEPLANQPVTLHLAAVPRVAGTNLAVSVKMVKGIQVSAAGALNARKASANGAYRQHFSVTRQASAPAELRVLVTMDLPEGSGFGFFSIPLEPETPSQKLDSVKQR